MFTGIVAAIGSIRQVSPLGEDGVRLDVAAGELDMSDVAIGDSIAIQGACMTVVEKTADSFAVDVSAESLRRTTGLAGTGPVNLEKAMRLSDRVGGHLVSGHVDGLGVVRRFEPVGESHLLEILAPQALRLMLPTLITQMVTIIKGTTLAYVLSYPDLMYRGSQMIGQAKKEVHLSVFFQTYIIIAVLYVIVNWALGALARYIESRTR